MSDTIKEVLILGDGNFSFSLALSRKLWQPATESDRSDALRFLGIDETQSVRLTATSFDSREDLYEKYPDSKFILNALLDQPEVTVMHGINAWEVSDKHFQSRTFDLILWNHPHLGTEDFRLHRFLMAHFFASCRPAALKIMLSLVEGQETRWSVADQARRSGFLVESVKPFRDSDWPGFEPKRNTYGGSFKNIHTQRRVKTAMRSCAFTFACIDAANVIPDFQLALSKALDESKLSDVVSCAKPVTKGVKNKKKQIRLDAISESLVCEYCNKQLDSPRAYSQHKHNVHVLKKYGDDWRPEKPKTLQCPSCPKMFASLDDLAQHETNKHSSISASDLPNLQHLSLYEAADEQNFPDSDYDYEPCSVCGQAVIKRSYGMHLHLESLKPLVGLSLTCPKCPLKFIDQRALLQHFKFCKK